jgi:hypothetical protein
MKEAEPVGFEQEFSSENDCFLLDESLAFLLVFDAEV